MSDKFPTIQMGIDNWPDELPPARPGLELKPGSVLFPVIQDEQMGQILERLSPGKYRRIGPCKYERIPKHDKEK